MYAEEAIRVIRDSLRTNLTDPRIAMGGTSRGGDYWIFGDEPITGIKYPQIQLRKLDNPTEVISIGPNYMESEYCFVNIWFSWKNGRKITISGTEYTNAQAVEYYLGQIKSTLKAQFNNLHTSGVIYRHMNTTTVEYDPETQLYFGAVSTRLWYFN